MQGSIQSGHLGKIAYIPLDQISRPIAPVLEHEKIDAMVSTLQGVPQASTTCALENITAGELPPIDVLCVRENGVNRYFAFGGCHRFQAYEKSGVPMVKCKILPCTRKQLRLYLGASVDRFFENQKQEE